WARASAATPSISTVKTARDARRARGMSVLLSEATLLVGAHGSRSFVATRVGVLQSTLAGQPERDENAERVAARGDQHRRAIALRHVEEPAGGDRQHDRGGAPGDVEPARDPAVPRAAAVDGHRRGGCAGGAADPHAPPPPG